MRSKWAWQHWVEHEGKLKSVLLTVRVCSWKVCPCGVLPSAAWRAPRRGFRGTASRPAWRSPTLGPQTTTCKDVNEQTKCFICGVTVGDVLQMLSKRSVCIRGAGLTRRSGVCRLGRTRLPVPSTSPAAVPAESIRTRYTTLCSVSLVFFDRLLHLCAHNVPPPHPHPLPASALF